MPIPGPSSDAIHIERADPTFNDWHSVLDLLHQSFAYQSTRIDPPSSLHALDEHLLARKAQQEHLIIACHGADLIGCVFAKIHPDRLYIGKMAVAPDRQGQGTGKMLMQAAESLAREHDLQLLELQTRVELTENHETFARLGFVKVAESAHAGYNRPTSITMQKRLKPDPGK